MAFRHSPIVLVLTTSLSLLAGVAMHNPYRSGRNSGIASVRAFAKTNESEARTRVAAGEYLIKREPGEAGIGTYAPGLYNFSESWTIWRLSDGSFEVRGQREYESPKDEFHSNSFSVGLGADFCIRNLTEFRKLRWRPDSGPLSCEFQPTKMACSSGTKDPGQAINLSMPMKDAYGFLWPISAFSLSNITRHAERIVGKLTPVQLVTVEEESEQNPVFISVLDGELRYLGRDEVILAGAEWRADEFELKVPLHPAFVIWTSPEGLLLRFAPESSAKTQADTGMTLVHFLKWASF